MVGGRGEHRAAAVVIASGWRHQPLPFAPGEPSPERRGRRAGVSPPAGGAGQRRSVAGRARARSRGLQVGRRRRLRRLLRLRLRRSRSGERLGRLGLSAAAYRRRSKRSCSAWRCSVELLDVRQERIMLSRSSRYGSSPPRSVSRKSSRSLSFLSRIARTFSYWRTMCGRDEDQEIRSSATSRALGLEQPAQDRDVAEERDLGDCRPDHCRA